MNIDYSNLEQDLLEGSFRQRLEEELTLGFSQLYDSGERLPPASYYAAQIAQIVNNGAELSPDLKYNLYQEILLAVENARAAILGEEVKPN